MQSELQISPRRTETHELEGQNSTSPPLVPDVLLTCSCYVQLAVVDSMMNGIEGRISINLSVRSLGLNSDNLTLQNCLVR